MSIETILILFLVGLALSFIFYTAGIKPKRRQYFRVGEPVRLHRAIPSHPEGEMGFIKTKMKKGNSWVLFQSDNPFNPKAGSMVKNDNLRRVR